MNLDFASADVRRFLPLLTSFLLSPPPPLPPLDFPLIEFSSTSDRINFIIKLLVIDVHFSFAADESVDGNDKGRNFDTTFKVTTELTSDSA